MEEIINNYYKYYEDLNYIVLNSYENNNVAIIIEPTNHIRLIGAIKNVMNSLGNKWNLHIFGSKNNYEIIKKKIYGNYKFTKLECEEFNNLNYNTLLQTSSFWENISEENILFFNVNSIIKNFNYDFLFKFPFIGAPFYNKSEYINNSVEFSKLENEYLNDLMQNFHLINPTKQLSLDFDMYGHFSFRKKSVMLDCLKNVSVLDIIKYRKNHNYSCDNLINKIVIDENSFFINAIKILGYPLPSLLDSVHFCSFHYVNFFSFAYTFDTKDLNEFDILFFFNK